MNSEIKSYLKVEAIISAAFNFFINGMVSALIHHKADTVAMDPISTTIDLLSTCLFIFILTELFSRSSLKRTKTVDIIDSPNGVFRIFRKLFKTPAIFGLVIGLIVAIILAIITALIFLLLTIQAIPFGVYIVLKCVFCTVLGGSATALELFTGMCKAK